MVSAKISLILLMIFITGCTSIGPDVLTRDRYQYNTNLQLSNKQEHLLNLVRARYDESAMSVKVSSINGSTRLDRNGSISGFINFPPTGPSGGTSTGSTGMSYGDNPVISYSPLDNQTFNKAYLTPLRLRDIGLLVRAGWSIARVFRVTLQSAGYNLNAPSSARPTTSHVPKYKEFLEFVYFLRDLQIDDAIELFYESDGAIEKLTILIRKDYRFNPKQRHAIRKLHIPLTDNAIVLSNVPQPGKMFVITRSMFGILNYLSKGLIVPPADAKSKALDQTYYPNGKVFDWQLVVRGMMKINYSDTKPGNASVSIPYRGRWYYIDDTDNDSKQTMILLTNILGLVESVPNNNQSPVGLTRNI